MRGIKTALFNHMKELVDQIKILENEIICLIDEVEEGRFYSHRPMDGRKLSALRAQLESMKMLLDSKLDNEYCYLSSDHKLLTNQQSAT